MLTNPEEQKNQMVRINILACIILVIFLVFAMRLWFLQMVKGDNLLEAAEDNRIKILHVRASRGSILDCKGKVLATSRPQFVVMAVIDKIKDNKKAMDTLCDILQMSREEVLFEATKLHAREGLPVRIAVDVPMEVVAKISEHRMDLPGVSVDYDQIRDYPDGEAVAHIMGYIGEVSQEQYEISRLGDNPYRLGDYVGKSGLEKQYEDYLRGTDGGKQIEVNAAGRVIRVLGEKVSVPGDTLVLSINRDLQLAAYEALKGRVGSVVALDPKTGAVLAMVNAPSYDPNMFARRINAKDWHAIVSNKHHPLQNRAINNVYPPGSTFKPIMSIAGLVYGECSTSTTVNCPGYFNYGRRFGCWKTHGAGVNFNRAMAESCDVWYYKLGLRLGIDRIAKVAEEFGLGKATGIDLPAESRHEDNHVGTMPSTKWKKKRFKKPENQKWYSGETPSCSIGQGYIETSPLQMALVCAGCANNGKIFRPTLVDEIRDPKNKLVKKTLPTLSGKVNAKEEYFKYVRDAMRMTVTRGTGTVADVEGIYVGAKTGSAENKGAAHAWFICFASRTETIEPDIAIACIVEHGEHGASAAAPVCRAILDVYYGKHLSDGV